MTILETRRLILREFTLADVEEVAAIYADPIVMATKGGVRPYGYAEHTVQEAIRDYALFGYGFWATVERSSEKLIGLCGLLNQTIDNQPEVEVAYTLAHKFWGNGFATEAAQTIAEWAFAHLDVNRIISLISSDNVRSQRVAQKNGMCLVQEFTEPPGNKVGIWARSRP